MASEYAQHAYTPTQVSEGAMGLRSTALAL